MPEEEVGQELQALRQMVRELQEKLDQLKQQPQKTESWITVGQIAYVRCATCKGQWRVEQVPKFIGKSDRWCTWCGAEIVIANLFDDEPSATATTASSEIDD